jgi:pimeloyl-ACP methyl ester carboxylesterase
MKPAGELVVAGKRLEYTWHGPGPEGAPTLVLLHEGLGCVGMWRDFPARIARETGWGALVYSRAGYGASDSCDLPRPLRYMHDEALDVLPAVLDAAGIRDAALVGHSDGASIAIVHAARARGRERVRALVLEAPHVFVEDVSVASIAAARDAYVNGDLRERLARWHGANVDCAFWGWNRAWLDPEFRRWNLEEYLADVRVPVLVVQGEDDEYGTLAQVRAIEAGAGVRVESLLLPRCGHSPHRDQPDATAEAIRRFVGGLG